MRKSAARCTWRWARRCPNRAASTSPVCTGTWYATCVKARSMPTGSCATKTASLSFKIEREAMSFHIRPSTPGDYVAMIAINRAIYPDYAATEDEMRYWDEHRDPVLKFQRWVAEQEGRVAGIAQYNHSPEGYHPRKFWINISVHPDARRHGIGSALYEQIVEELQPFDPLNLRSRVREDMSPGIQFLQARGYQDVWKDWESRLDLATFDASPYQGLEEKLRGQGIEIKSRKELEADPQCYSKLHELGNEVAND